VLVERHKLKLCSLSKLEAESATPSIYCNLEHGQRYTNGLSDLSSTNMEIFKQQYQSLTPKQLCILHFYIFDKHFYIFDKTFHIFDKIIVMQNNLC